MIYYIDGEEVNEKIAKAYFFDGHKRTQEWMNKHHGPGLEQMSSAEHLWKIRRLATVQDQIHSISGIQEKGGLEISEN